MLKFHSLSGNQAHEILSKDASSPTFSITIRSILPLAIARASDSSSSVHDAARVTNNF